MGKKSKAEKAKIKVKVVENKLKVVNKQSENLEGELEKEEREQFNDFVETGEMRAPVLETGQASQTSGASGEQRVSPIERATGESPRQTQPGQVAGAVVNPEFSVYEIARGLGRPGGGGGGRVRYETSRERDEVMQRRIPAPATDEMQANLMNTRQGFVNPELERLRAGDDRGGKYYEATVKGEEVKKDRKMPWEA